MEKKKNVNALCGWSLACYLGYWLPAVVALLIAWITKPDISSYEGFLVAFAILVVFFLCWGIRITSWVLMIVARVKDNNSKFANALMWIYIGLLIFGIVTYMLLLVSSLVFTIVAGPIIGEIASHR